MSATTNHSVTRGILPAVVLGVLFSLVLSVATASAMRVYDGAFARHAQLRHHVAGKTKHRAHRRVRARAAASPTFNLCAKAGTVTPDGAPGAIPIWGFAVRPVGGCAAATAGIPAPPLDVGAGDNVTLSIENSLDEALHISIPGITIDAGATPNTRTINPGDTGTVSFTASSPGTYLYESDGTAGRQAEVGLAGALIVRPPAAGQAYADASTSYDTEALMVLSEIDANLNATLPTPGGLASFDMATWKPQYRLINGLSYPSTGTINSAAGSKVLLRYVNAGSEHVSMTLLGADATVVGREGAFLTTPLGVTSETIPDGATAEEIVTIPAGAASGTKFPIYDRNLNLVNGSAAGIGGRLRFIQVP